MVENFDQPIRMLKSEGNVNLRKISLFNYKLNLTNHVAVETDKERNERIKNVMRKQLTNLGKTSTHEWSILICFVILIALWFFREQNYHL